MSSKELNLSFTDLQMFAKIGVDEAMLREAGIHRITHGEATDAGFRYNSTNMAGIVFPYFNAKHSRTGSRLRRDCPEVDGAGRPQAKYISSYSDRRHLYFPPGAWEMIDDNRLVVIVESEKAALALMGWAQRTGQHLLAVATGGCYGWRGKITKQPTPNGGLVDVKGPLPELAMLTRGGHEIILAFDANAATNSKVRIARHELARHLATLGAHVRVAETPCIPGVNGPDDLIAVAGDAALLKVLDSARTYEVVSVSEAERAIASLTSDSSSDEVNSAARLIAEVQNRDKRQLLIADAAKSSKCKLKDLREAVAQHACALVREAKTAQEQARREALLRMEVDPMALVLRLESFFASRAYLPHDAALVLALWTMNTWTYGVFKTTPYLLLSSATKGCGKTTLMELLEKVCCHPQRITTPSAAVLYRLIDRDRPTLLIDEAEVIRDGRGDTAEMIRSIARSGYKRGDRVPRCVGQNNDVEYFDVFCPKAFAAIGGLEGALLDRCIVVQLEKAPPTVKLGSTRERVLLRDAEPLCELLEAYALQVTEPLIEYYESEPDEGYWPLLHGRDAEIWSPLLMHARGAKVEQRALAAALRFSRLKGQAQRDEQQLAFADELLRALESIEGDRFTPNDVVDELEGYERWGALFGVCPNRMAKCVAVGRFLSSFGIAKLRHGRTGSWYALEPTRQKLRDHLPQEIPETDAYKSLEYQQLSIEIPGSCRDGV